MQRIEGDDGTTGDTEFGQQRLCCRDFVGFLGDVDVGKHERGVSGEGAEHFGSGAIMERVEATALLLSDLGVTRSHNRPHTSNDNPYSEAHFKTLKYQPRFPKTFGCVEDARTFCRSFFD